MVAPDRRQARRWSSASRSRSRRCASDNGMFDFRPSTRTYTPCPNRPGPRGGERRWLARRSARSARSSRTSTRGRRPTSPSTTAGRRSGTPSRTPPTTRIAQQASQLNIKKIKVWAYRARVHHRGRRALRDTRLPRVPQAAGHRARVRPEAPRSAPSGTSSPALPKTSQQYFLDFASGLRRHRSAGRQDDYTSAPSSRPQSRRR